uniref:NADH-ubiquinone oxidoreductase chain 4 n=1 Tax=Atractolytocestus huronensis TaxID=507542 RepID=A0A343EST0_9CEST|nr:NADH dehydrogenase subunit 4 [Atractolytocestus huronensis]ASL24616.1 NADH dehydrogenase subunit 4 [Atractolytocestus huronensis]
MGVWRTFGLCWGVVLSFILLLCLLLPFGSGVFTRCVGFDHLSLYLSLLVVVLGLSAVLFNYSEVEAPSKMFLLCSLGFSVCCFVVNNSIVFWCFYELAMLPLLFLVFQDSPYSERFVAGCYFSGYLLITSLPLLLILCYLSFINETCVISCWSNYAASAWIYVVLALVFFTKVPLCPFHTWLPIVHAEATSVVSTFLSGYIMKLGVVGVFRFTGGWFNGSFVFYILVCCVMAVGFLVSASLELDGKRWLALLSLSHIVVPVLGLFVCGWSLTPVVFLYSLGHGLSAGIVFGLLWLFYNNTNTRNWVLLKTGIGGKGVLVTVVMGLLSLCSFPTTIQFFMEVSLVTTSSYLFMFLVFWFIYLFLGGLVPLVLCGHSILRVEAIESIEGGVYRFVPYLVVFIVWCYLGVCVF